jgi:hypothetical protein
MTPKEGDDRSWFEIVSPEFDKHILETCMTLMMLFESTGNTI